MTHDIQNTSKRGFALLAIGLCSCASSDGASTGDGGGAAQAEGGGATLNDAGVATGGDAVSGGGATPGVDAAAGANAMDGGGSMALAPGAVNLRSAGNYAILAMSGISTVPTSAVTGDLGIYPAAASSITGFPLTADATNEFSTSPQVTGKIYAYNYQPPTPLTVMTAVGDMQQAFTDAAGRAPKVTELGSGNIGGMTLTPGVYGWSTGLLIPENVTLTGSATDVWIFQIAGTLTVSAATSVILAGGALPENIFWQVSGAVALRATSAFEGDILAQTGIAMETGASINGRLLAQTAVTLESSTVVEP
jgi:hypothetical protein